VLSLHVAVDAAATQLANRLHDQRLSAKRQHLSIAKMLSDWNVFEISDIQDIQLSCPNPGDQDVMLHWVENRRNGNVQRDFTESTPHLRMPCCK
jgi:hypothetical protein